MSRRRAALIAGCLLLAVALLVRCGGDGSKDAELATVLTDAFAAAEQSGEPVDFDALVDGAWTRVVFVCPYEDADKVTERLGFEWPEFPGRDDSEVRALFVFADEAEVVRWTELGRFRGDPCDSLDPVLPRDAAAVVVTSPTTTSGGDPFLVLQPARSD